MNLLYIILKEYVDSIISGTIHDWLGLDKNTLYNFEFFFSSKKISEKKFNNREIFFWIALLMYFTCLKNYKKLFWSKFNMVQFCSLESFFTRTISFLLLDFSEVKLKQNSKLRGAFQKLFYGILISKQIKELENCVQFWRNRFSKFLINEILNQSCSETLKKNLLYSERKFFCSQYSYSQPIPVYFIKKRFNCMLIFLLEPQIFFKKNFFANSNLKETICVSEYKFLLKKINPKKIILNCIDNLMLYFSKENVFFRRRINHLFSFLKSYSIQIRLNKKISHQKDRQNKEGVKKRKIHCTCINSKKFDKNNNSIKVYQKNGKTFKFMSNNPFESLY